MSFNGSGTFVINSAGQPVVANTLIQASVFNAFTSDVATGLSTCITKDGQTVVTANIPFAGFRATNVGLSVINGSVGTPGIAFLSNLDMGLYRIGDGNLGISTAGVKRLDLDATRLLVVDHLYFSDAAYDIGTSASVSVTGRPRDLWLSRNLSVPGISALSSVSAVDVSASSLVASTVGGAMVATQAQIEAALSNNVAVSPGRLQYHPGVAKAWIHFDGSSGSIGTGYASYNMDAVTDNGTGNYSVNFTTDFSTSNYSFALGGNINTGSAGGAFIYSPVSVSPTASSLRVGTASAAATPADWVFVSVVAYGDQA